MVLVVKGWLVQSRIGPRNVFPLVLFEVRCILLGPFVMTLVMVRNLWTCVCILLCRLRSVSGFTCAFLLLGRFSVAPLSCLFSVPIRVLIRVWGVTMWWTVAYPRFVPEATLCVILCMNRLNLGAFGIVLGLRTEVPRSLVLTAKCIEPLTIVPRVPSPCLARVDLAKAMVLRFAIRLSRLLIEL